MLNKIYFIYSWQPLKSILITTNIRTNNTMTIMNRAVEGGGGGGGALGISFVSIQSSWLQNFADLARSVCLDCFWCYGWCARLWMCVWNRWTPETIPPAIVVVDSCVSLLGGVGGPTILTRTTPPPSPTAHYLSTKINKFEGKKIW